MPLINLVIILVVIGFVLWLINKFIPMESTIKNILNIIIIIAIIFWLLSIFGVLGSIETIRI